jgi:hypothetical protein
MADDSIVLLYELTSHSATAACLCDTGLHSNSRAKLPMDLRSSVHDLFAFRVLIHLGVFASWRENAFPPAIRITDPAPVTLDLERERYRRVRWIRWLGVYFSGNWKRPATMPGTVRSSSISSHRKA